MMKETKEKKRDEETFFSDRKKVIRLVLFLLSLAVAISAISYGVYRMGYKEEGSYVIEAAADSDLPFYATGIQFSSTLTGSSAEIKARLNQLKEDYSLTLKTTYQLFDAENTYPGLNNIAAINQSIGQDVKVTRELFDVLSDAWEKTQKGEGYSVFSGPLNRYYSDLLFAFEPADPLQDKAAEELTRALADAIYQENAATLTLNQKDLTVRLEISRDLADLLDEYGMDHGVLDLGVLYDAYRLQVITDALEAKGDTVGYLSTESGLTVMLSEQEDLWYCFYSEQNGDAVISAQVPGKAGTAASLFRVFPLGDEDGFYTLKAGGKTIARHPYGWSESGESVVTAALTRTDRSHLVESAYQNFRLLAAQSREDALALLAESRDALLLTLAGEDGKIHSKNADGTIAAKGFSLVK